MMIALLLVYHLVLLFALMLASNTFSGLEILVSLVLVGMGGFVLFEMFRSIEPRRAAQRRRGP